MPPRSRDETQVEYLDDPAVIGPRVGLLLLIATLIIAVAGVLVMPLLRPAQITAQQLPDIYQPALTTPGGDWASPQAASSTTFGSSFCSGKLGEVLSTADTLVRARAERRAWAYTGSFADRQAAQEAYAALDHAFTTCVQDRFRWTRGADRDEPRQARYVQFIVESTSSRRPGWLRRELVVVQYANTVSVFMAHYNVPASGLADAYATRIDELARLNR